MNRLLFILLTIACLSACSQKQFGFRQKVNAGKEQARNQPRKHTDVQPVNPKDSVVAFAAKQNQAGLHLPDSLAKQEIDSHKEKKQISASLFKGIIPFNTDHLSPEEPGGPVVSPRQRNETEGGVLGYISLVLGLFSIFALLSLVFVTSNTLGVFLLFSAPVLGAIALILGIMSVSDNSGRGMGWAGIVMGSFILLVTLIMVLIAYLFIQSSIN